MTNNIIIIDIPSQNAWMVVFLRFLFTKILSCIVDCKITFYNQNLGGGGEFEGQTHILGGQDRIFKKVQLFVHAVVTGLFSPPRRFAPLSKGGDIPRPYRPRGTNILGISPPPRGANAPGISPPHPLGYSPPIYAMWFIQIIS